MRNHLSVPANTPSADREYRRAQKEAEYLERFAFSIIPPAEEHFSRRDSGGSTHRDPTANAAIGAVDRQLRRMRREAEQIALLNRQGKFTPEMEAAARRRFTGIFRPLLEKALRG